MEGLIPKTLKEALDALSKDKYLPVAGGTDLMVRYKRWKNLAPCFPYPPIFIAHLSELTGIEKDGNEIVIKSATLLSEIEKSPLIPSILKKAVSCMAAPGIRNMATIGGNIVNSSPAGDTLPPLYVLDAKVVLLSRNERRCFYIYDFITGPGKNQRRDDELLYEIRFHVPDYTHEMYRKVGTRKANALSKLSVSAIASVIEGKIEDFRISFGAVAPTPVRVKDIEDKVKSKHIFELDEGFINGIVNEYSLWIKPIDDQRSTSLYRKCVSLRLLKEFLNRIKNGSYLEDKE